MNFILKIDFREHDLVAALNQIDDLEFTKENLELGDITLEVNNKTIILIERKKMPDLSNSLYDGRYKEQKKRIKEALHPNVRKIYLIEGNSFFKTKLNKKTLDGIKINTMLRDNLHIVHVKNFQETIEFIINIYKRIGKYAKELYAELDTSSVGDNVKDNNSYSEVCNINKKKNLTPEVYKIIQFQQIPKVSNAVAKLIVQEVGSIKDILLKYKSDEEINIVKKSITELKFGEKMRRIGPKLAQTIIDYIYS
jgi:ERCC4-type nuclease